jgi:hypothetical protein
VKNLLLSIIIPVILFISCQYEVPAEMVIGHWEIESIEENSHDFTEKYVNQYTKYIQFEENGTFKQGVMDNSEKKNWLIYPDKSKLFLLNGSPIENVTEWKVRASDEHLELSDLNNHYKIILRKIDEIPIVNLKEKEDLVGKWVIDKVTINGYDNTKEYANIDRWIILSDDGQFFNGGNKENLNSGVWALKPNLTQIDFFNDKSSSNTSITFNIEDEFLWYEKQNAINGKPVIKVYFKKQEI